MGAHSKETKGTKVNENKTRTVYRHTTVQFATSSGSCTVTKTSTRYDKVTKTNQNIQIQTAQQMCMLHVSLSP